MDALKLLSRSTGLKTKISKSSQQNIPSASGLALVAQETESIGQRKRKRDSDVQENGSASPSVFDDLSEEEIRQVHKKHKIKIVDLDRFRAAGEASESRKLQKEQSRIFPQPLVSFDQLHSRYDMAGALTRNISNQAYFEPTEVQTAALPLLLKGSDDDSSWEPNLLTIAPTGSGKTLAFLIPLIEKISRAHRGVKKGSENHVRALILAPTKELVTQIVNEGRKLCAKTGVGITALRKGMKLFEDSAPSHNEESEIDEDEDDDDTEDELPSRQAPLVKADILVTTPLSLVHIISPGWEDESSPVHALPKIETLILDEADVLLDPLFRAQTLTAWSACTSPSMRISMWSATIGSNIEELAVQTISDRQKRLKLSRTQRPRLLRIIIGLKDTSLPTISHRLVYTATESGKLLGMRQLLHPSRSAPSSKGNHDTAAPLRPPFLVFTQTIDRAQALYAELQYDIPAQAGGSSRVAVLHSSLTTRARASIMENFRQGKIWILITTDLLSRGVDFRGVNVVVNYDIPTTAAGYVHRAGRTGRAGREGGVCVSFYTKEDIPYVKGIANVIAASEKAQTNSEGATNGDAKDSGRGASSTSTPEGIPSWLLQALPSVSKSVRKDLKLHGVASRRAIHADDDENTRRMKRKSRIGTQSGYERREVNRKRAAVERSQQAKRKAPQQKEAGEDWQGFG